nr:hypothetical protein [Bradyrhizobium sp. 2S1]MCK7668491.1 hypothetical protein [Bradyrhizobium sp. 2S1]
MIEASFFSPASECAVMERGKHGVMISQLDLSTVFVHTVAYQRRPFQLTL